MHSPLPVIASVGLSSGDLVPPPRSYQDTVLPPEEIREGFDSYVAWLVGHLETCYGAMPHSQTERAAAHAQLTPKRAASSLGWEVGFGWDMESSVALAVKNGLGYEGFIQQERQNWGEEDKSNWQPDEAYLSRADWERMSAEERERIASGCSAEEADIPFRPLLAALVKRAASQEEKTEILKAFFASANEASRK